MRRLRFFINHIIAFLGDTLQRRKSYPEDIPKKLDAETLMLALQEARFLHMQHAVDVTSLAPGELPGIPKRADFPQE